MTSQPASTVTAGEDFARWRPGQDAVDAAVAALAAQPAGTLASIPLYMPGKRHGWWETGQPVHTVPGVLFFGANTFTPPAGTPGYGQARIDAARAAWAALGEVPGTVAWATVDAVGRVGVTEDPLTRDQFEALEEGHATPPTHDRWSRQPRSTP